MAELEAIAETLKRQRQDLEELQDRTLSRRGETAELVKQLEDLRLRSEATQRRYQASVAESNSTAKK